LKIKDKAKSIIILLDRLDYDFSDHPAVLFAELPPGKRCNSSDIPEPATKNKLQMDSTKTNY
jgi:hypothetical protein